MKQLLTAAFLCGTAQALQATAISEQDLIAAVLVAECGGEKQPIIAMSAVLEVIWKRSTERRESFHEVLLKRKQFSCLNGVTIAELTARSCKHPRWLDAWALAGHRPTSNFSKGANHYHSASVRPAWSRGRTPVAIIGNHKFYRL